MRSRNWGFLALMIVLCISNAHAQLEPVLSSRIKWVGLFKNGLTYVKREINVPKEGSYIVEDVPDAVHGTFAFESQANVQMQFCERLMPASEEAPDISNFQSDLAGSEVKVFLAEPNALPIEGKVISFEASKRRKTWDKHYQTPQGYYGYYGSQYSANSIPNARFLALDSNKQRIYIDTSKITRIESSINSKPTLRPKRVLLLTVSKTKEAATKIELSYLSKGLSWAPSYQVDLTESNQLTISQDAAIRNEFEDLKDAEIQLITGFPGIQFTNVSSPLSSETSWKNFFQQLNQKFEPGHEATLNVVSQQVRNVAPQMDSAIDINAATAQDGNDLYYHSIGKHTLAEGDALALRVAAAKASYKPLVEWQIPDTRDPYGAQIQNYERQREPERFENVAWDAVQFTNPFNFPMTTAASTYYKDDKIIGQRLLNWSNAGEKIIARINRALSIRTSHVETEAVDQSRKVVGIGSRNYRQVTVTGEIRVTSFRSNPVELLIRREFSGELLSAEGSPEKTLLETGVYSTNPRNQLQWNLKIEPKVQSTIRYEYQVLVPN